MKLIDLQSHLAVWAEAPFIIRTEVYGQNGATEIKYLSETLSTNETVKVKHGQFGLNDRWPAH